MDDVELAGLRSLFESPAPAVLMTHRRDGSAAVSPVWFRLDGDAFEVVVATSDPKFGHIGRDPRVQLIVFETVPPFRGVSVRTDAELDPDEARVGAARLAISSRYLGPEAGARFTASRGPGVVVRMHADHAEAWDLSQALNAV